MHIFVAFERLAKDIEAHTTTIVFIYKKKHEVYTHNIVNDASWREPSDMSCV